MMTRAAEAVVFACALAQSAVTTSAEASATAAEAALVEEEAACANSEEGSEECSGLSLRQLRGEQNAMPLTVEDVEGVVSEQLADNVEPILSRDEAEDCRVARHMCGDFVTYSTKAECAAFDGCAMVANSEEEGSWMCKPSNAKCDIGLDNFVSSEADVDADVDADAVADDNDFEEIQEDEEEGFDMDDIDVDAIAEDVQMKPSYHRYQYTPTFRPPEPNIMTLYHTTSVNAAMAIVKTGFRPGHSGWCGGAIYFIDHPHLPQSKYAPEITQAGAVLEAKVDMGRMAHMGHRCGTWRGRGTGVAARSGHQSIRFNPGDGDEYVIWDPKQVLSIRIYEFM